jgi:2,4-dienoyl-CoA reductase-like NADH-dependent reductase (Old Yellow Enzyme family)
MIVFEPFELRSCRLPNRIAMSPMTQRRATAAALPTDWHLVHYGSRAVGGCGLVMLEDTAVCPQGRTDTASLGLYERAQADALARIVTFCQQQGAAVGIQLAHAGRKALADTHGAAEMLAPTAQRFADGWRMPQPADESAIAYVLCSFARAARLAADAGFDAVEVHAGHGFLLHQFLSPLVNTREDGYGGSPAGRARLLLDVVEAVRQNWPPERPLLVRLPASDGVQGGSTLQEMVQVALGCVRRGADLIDISGGSPLFRGPHVDSQTMLAFARTLSCGAPRIATAIGGGVDGGPSAQHLLQSAGASLLTVGRPLLRNPHWALLAAEQLHAPTRQGATRFPPPDLRAISTADPPR